ncbi:MAG: hypothetical protein HOV80_18030 [Polyangiaceae bacterium]|nr:hypothetical protein [Polyangiaceae bacterium]
MRQVAAHFLLVGSLSACSSRGSSSILSEAGCHEESRQEIGMTADMCVGALAQASAAAAPPPPPPPPAATGSASAGEAPPPPPPEPPPPAPQPDAASLDPTKCEIDCNRACGNVPDSVCKRLDDKLVECAVVRLGDPCK